MRLHQLIGQAGDFWDYTTGPVISADSTGKYTFTNLTDGQFYTVGASAYRHATSVLGGGTDPTAGTAFRATQNRPTLPNLTLADATGLTGSVSSAFGPTEGVTVELIRWVEAWGAFADAGAATTGPTGTYRFDELVPGTYAVHIDPTGADRPLKSTWLGGGDEPSTSTDPRLFTVGAVPTEIRKDVTLAARQVVRGRATSATGARPARGRHRGVVRLRRRDQHVGALRERVDGIGRGLRRPGPRRLDRDLQVLPFGLRDAVPRRQRRRAGVPVRSEPRRHRAR